MFLEQKTTTTADKTALSSHLNTMTSHLRTWYQRNIAENGVA
jgi:hypothetical protein